MFLQFALQRPPQTAAYVFAGHKKIKYSFPFILLGLACLAGTGSISAC
jgi:hypothetical protein